MTEPSAKRGSTETSRIIKAPRAKVYRACLDPEALAIWRAPDSMTGRMHAFDAREGGAYRMSLTYHDKTQSPGGKTSEDTDTFKGRFLELVPNEKIVELIAFESDDPRFAGEMTITTRFADAGPGTQITMLFENIPSGVSPQDNETGTQQSLRKLAALVEE
ncbi:SRPBCC family protein [Roseiarcaceae bacterium H3SJ34-1]|uniref:SRPBCC family protein n=1 Tax=Terripilifer ovatus TaxID=3032367 RepID=UPI003AB930F7|nr:SRPBCC family protein [Roseiarcaceae bacterium H3SJ34-1]